MRNPRCCFGHKLKFAYSYFKGKKIKQGEACTRCNHVQKYHVDFYALKRKHDMENENESRF